MTVMREMTPLRQLARQEVVRTDIAESVAGWFYHSFSNSTQLILLKELRLDNKKSFSSAELRKIIEAAKKKSPHLQHAKVVEYDPKKETPSPFTTILITCVEEIGINGLVYLCREHGVWVLKYTAQAINESRDKAMQRMRKGHTPADKQSGAW